jgi:rhodanese-related sulfurtransferase
MASAGSHTGSSLSMSMWMVVTGIRKKFPRVNHISVSDFNNMMEKEGNILCLDTRAPDEYAVSRISNSKQIDYQSPTPWKDIDLNNINKVVCYCSVGYRSSIVADKLTEHFKDQRQDDISVYNLEGGIFQWVISGNKVNGETDNKVHHYSTLWGKLLPTELRYVPSNL